MMCSQNEARNGRGGAIQSGVSSAVQVLHSELVGNRARMGGGSLMVKDIGTVSISRTFISYVSATAASLPLLRLSLRCFEPTSRRDSFTDEDGGGVQ